MSTLRRLILVPFATALVVGLLGITPAHASFGGSTTLPTMSVTTVTVAAPGNFAGSLTCPPSGTGSATMAASWTASPTRGVSGYLITVYFSDGSSQTVQLGSTATSWSASIGILYVTAYQVRYSVTTLTSYNWTAMSATTAWFHC